VLRSVSQQLYTLLSEHFDIPDSAIQESVTIFDEQHHYVALPFGVLSTHPERREFFDDEGRENRRTARLGDDVTEFRWCAPRSIES
jgi:hypothetical protein